MTQEPAEGEGTIEAAGSGTTVNLSLISHTNAGKTTLARTLLGRDVGEVRDAAHVTDLSSGYVLVQAGDDTLMLWDTPGFGDTARLLSRLRMSGNPIGWFVTQVWDRWRERPLWSSQQAVKNARSRADVILYLVNAAEDPAAASYVALEMEVLAWIGKPVLLLLNQMGPPRADPSGAIERWRGHVAGFADVAGALPLDAFARCWVQEGALLDTVAPLLPADKQPAMARLSARWKDLNRDRFAASIDVLARSLGLSLGDSEDVREGDWFDKAANSLRAGRGESREVKDALAKLGARLESETRASTEALIRLHGLDGTATAQVLDRVGKSWSLSSNTPAGAAAVLGGLASGAVGGLAADVAAGGLTLGGGMIVGAILGALGAGGVAKGINLARGEDGAKLRWSADVAQNLAADALLRYLAVAHFGRGRGQWEEGEHPAFWQELVERVLGARRDRIAAIHASARSATRAELAEALRAVLAESAWAVLCELYPQPMATLGDPPPIGPAATVDVAVQRSLP